MAGLDMSVPQGTQRHSRASSASKVSEECVSYTTNYAVPLFEGWDYANEIIEAMAAIEAIDTVPQVASTPDRNNDLKMTDNTTATTIWEDLKKHLSNPSP